MAGRQRMDDPARAYKVLVCDLVGLKSGKDGKPDHSAVSKHIEASGGVFHEGPLADEAKLAKGKLHFFYQPHLSARESEPLPVTSGQYDAVIAAATFLPKDSVFKLGRRAHRGGHRQHGLRHLGRRQWRGRRGGSDEHAQLQQPGHGADGDEGAAESAARSSG